jgi:hypothetical protein
VSQPTPLPDLSLESLVAQVADEFRARQKHGERPEVEEYAARHPECAVVLREVLASLRILAESLGAPASADGAPATAPAEQFMSVHFSERPRGRLGKMNCSEITALPLTGSTPLGLLFHVLWVPQRGMSG